MIYTISSDGEDGPKLLTAKLASDAKVLAEGLVEDGRSCVEVTTPAGETMPIRMFAAMIRSAGSGST